jgi:hypothetical protein
MKPKEIQRLSQTTEPSSSANESFALAQLPHCFYDICLDWVMSVGGAESKYDFCREGA